MKSFYSVKLVILAVIFTSCSALVVGQTTNFNTPGGPYTYTVPNGVTAIGVTLNGGQGGNGAPSTSTGGKGGNVVATLAVSPGQVLNVYVGGQGANYNYSTSLGGANGGGNGYYGGGAGGGASDIRVGGTALTNRVLVAAGGGGGAYSYCGGNDLGGTGGGTTGGNGTYCGTTNYYNYYCGAGATQSGGGAGAGGGGGTGTLGVGGNAATYCCNGEGGGGGGYYGGGGGAFYGAGGGGSSYIGGSGVSAATTTSGTNSGNGSVSICAPNLGIITGNVPVCVGTTNTLGATSPGGSWSSGNTAVATVSSAGLVTGVSSGIVAISYSASITGCGSGAIVAMVTVNPSPAAVSGPTSVCPGSTVTLTDAGGGTWTASDFTKATIGSSSGIVTGIAAGNINITYTLPTGCNIIQPFTVNPLPPAISGVRSVCASGATTNLSDAVPFGTWSSSTPSVATVTGTGVVTGVTAGNTNITYTSPVGCITVAPVTVNPLPSPITGVTTVCVAGTTTLADAGGGSWSSGNPTLAIVGSSTGIVTGVSAGNSNITYTLPTGCTTFTSVIVNPIPNPITGVTSVCVGGTTTLSDATPGGIWTSSNTTYATALPTTGLVTGVSASNPMISYTLGTGCGVSTPITVNALPVIYAVTGGGGYCVGTPGVHVGLTFGASGINYKLYNGATLVSTVGGSNSGLDFGLQTAVGTYTVVGINSATTCTSNMSGSATVSINSLPNVYSVSGGGSFCAGGTGAHITLSGSDISVNYQLMVGGVPAGAPATGTGGALDFGAQTTAGAYTVVATNGSTGCTQNMSGSATITVNGLPSVYNVSSGGAYCAGGTGVAITLSGSDAGTVYQLFYGGVATGSPLSGTGSTLNFGVHATAGTYTVMATNPTTTCSANMTGTSVISINPLPAVYNVTGGGAYCAGGAGMHIGLNYASTGINYQLFHSSVPVGLPMAGTNSGLDFGLQTTTGTYTVVATDQITGCSQNMSGSAAISTNPIPTSFAVTGGGSLCAGGAGVHVELGGSTSGIQYQLFNGTSTVGSAMAGTGGILDFGPRTSAGTYTVVATNATTSCTNNMTGSATIVINPTPSVYIVSGTGAICVGGTGIDITQNSSDAGIRYQLYKGATPIGSPILGTGSLLDFGPQTVGGTYTVTATNLTTGCSAVMAGSGSVVVNPLPTAFTVTGGGSYCTGGIGVHIGLNNSTVGVNYQLSNSTGPVSSVVAGLGSGIDFGYFTVVDVYTVTATNVITGCVNNMTGSATVNQNPLPTLRNVIGGGNYCLGGSGVHVGIDTGDLGISYQLMFGAIPSGAVVTGSGAALDFGARTGLGSYTVIATDPLTTCSATMTGSATVGTNPLPAAHTVTGGGTYCVPGGLGVNVNLDASDPTINYQLVYNGSNLGSPVPGTGTSLGFGLQTGVGTYNVIAVDPATSCHSNMIGSAIVSTNLAPTVETMAGGGSYCAGSTGLHIGLTGSDTGILYQLYVGTTPIGATVHGTGTAVDFGLQTGAGTYTVVASPGGVCQTNMSGTSTITINPIPNGYSLTGGGSYCAGSTGLAVGLSGSDTEVVYQLFLGGAISGTPVAGTGSAITFGTQTASGSYTVIATDTVTHCASNSTSSGSVMVNVLPLPTVFDMNNGGHYCAGGSGVHVTLSGSSTNVNYQLMASGSPVGSVMAGTGTVLDFGSQTAGNYMVQATDAATTCQNMMADTAIVVSDPILTPVVSITNPTTGSHIVTFLKQTRDTLFGSASGAGTNPSYQWLINGFPVSGATNLNFVSRSFGDGDSATLQVTSNGNCGGVTESYSVIIHLKSNVGVAQVIASDITANVMPNPNRGTFTVVGSLASADDQDVTIEVTDLLGHVIYSSKSVARNGNIDEKVQLSNVANGMYILNLRSGGDSKVFHVIVEQ